MWSIRVALERNEKREVLTTYYTQAGIKVFFRKLDSSTCCPGRRLKDEKKKISSSLSCRTTFCYIMIMLLKILLCLNWPIIMKAPNLTISVIGTSKNFDVFQLRIHLLNYLEIFKLAITCKTSSIMGRLWLRGGVITYILRSPRSITAPADEILGQIMSPKLLLCESRIWMNCQ